MNTRPLDTRHTSTQPVPTRTNAAPEAMQHITLSDASVAYWQCGQGPALVLLHGWGGSSRYWRRTLESLSDTYTLYALDLPGYGHSPPQEGAPGIERAARLVLEFADALGVGEFAINGHSLAATVAVYTAALAPQRVRQLVLTCTGTYRNETERRIAEAFHSVLGLWVRLRRPWMADKRLIYRNVSRQFFYQVPSDDRLVGGLFEDFLRMDKRTGLAHAADVTRIDYHALLRSLQVPTLIIAASHDTAAPPMGAPYMQTLITGSHLHVIEQCGHLPMIECPDVYHHLLREFLA